jgi:hypothetical protein
MDIDQLVRRVSEQLAAQPSRRGIVSAMAKLAAGTGAVIASLRGPDAAGAQVGNSCCTGAPGCKGNKCPPHSRPRWSWYCEGSGGARFHCRDCYKRGPNGNSRHICTVVVRQ